MSSSFKKTLIVLAIISILGVGGILLAIKEIRYEGSLERIGESIAQVPGKIIVVSAQKIYQAYCAVTGGRLISSCGFGCTKRCSRPSKTANNPCTGNEQCEGACVINLPIPEIDSETGKVSRPELEPAALKNCRRITLPYNLAGRNTLMSFECPSSVNIGATCQKYEYDYIEIYWEYDNGMVNLYRVPQVTP